MRRRIPLSCEMNRNATQMISIKRPDLPSSNTKTIPVLGNHDMQVKTIFGRQERRKIRKYPEDSYCQRWSISNILDFLFSTQIAIITF